MTDFLSEMSPKERLLFDLAALEALVENDAYRQITLQELQNRMIELICHDDVFFVLRHHFQLEVVQ